MTDNPYRPEQLTLRIKHRHFIDTLRAHGVPAEQMPVTAPLCGDLLISYAFEQPEQFVMATPPLLAKAGVAPADCRPLALANFKGRFSAQLVRSSVHDGLIAVRTGGELEAVMLVFDGFWQGRVRPEIRGELVVCVPRRDVLLIADAAVPGALAALRLESSRAFGAVADNHALSLQQMQWTPEGWRLLEAAPEQIQ
jgi:hypothetical protein